MRTRCAILVRIARGHEVAAVSAFIGGAREAAGCAKKQPFQACCRANTAAKSPRPPYSRAQWRGNRDPVPNLRNRPQPTRCHRRRSGGERVRGEKERSEAPGAAKRVFL